MAGAKNGAASAAPGTPDMPDALETELVQAVVAPRRTVRHEGRDRGPGSVLLLPASEVARLRALGFLLPDVDAEPAPAAEPKGASPRPTVNGRDGTIVRVA